ncbi:hypothetical protein GCM10009715_09460 [Paeniglutamicibacter psychrophenolicus]
MARALVDHAKAGAASGSAAALPPHIPAGFGLLPGVAEQCGTVPAGGYAIGIRSIAAPFGSDGPGAADGSSYVPPGRAPARRWQPGHQ